MKRNRLIYYNPELKNKARRLRNDSTFSEVLFWLKIKGRKFGYEFHRQVPIDNFIVDFYCHELMLAIEIDGDSHINKADYDLWRQQRLENLGIKFIRFKDKDVIRNLNDVLRALESVIAEIEKEGK